MKLNIANHGVKKVLIVDQLKEKNDGKMSDKTSKKPIQELMIVHATPIKILA